MATGVYAAVDTRYLLFSLRETGWAEHVALEDVRSLTQEPSWVLAVSGAPYTL